MFLRSDFRCCVCIDGNRSPTTECLTIKITTKHRTGWLAAITLGAISLLSSGVSFAQNIGIVAPLNGSTLAGESVLFEWTADGAAVTQWRLLVGTQPRGKDIFVSGVDAAVTSLQVDGLPTDGSTVYVTLRWKVGGNARLADYVYTAAGGGGGNTAPTVTISAPANGATHDVNDVIAFTATANDAEDGDLSSGVSWASNLDGALGAGATINTSLSVGTHTVTASVTDSGSVSGNDSISAIVTSGGGSGVPTMLLPAPGSTLTGDSELFQWTANGAAVTQWRLLVGTQPRGKDIFKKNFSADVTSRQIDGLPTDGSTVYVRLRWTINGVRTAVDYVYTASGSGGSNAPPSFTSLPPTTAAVAVPYSYDADATDPNSADVLSYSLDQAPAGMSIDSASGLIAWTPVMGDEGVNNVVVRVQDNGSPIESQTQSFNIFVSAAGTTSPNLLYFSTDRKTVINGVPAPYDDADIYAFDPTTESYTRVFDGRNTGLKAGTDIDALHVVDPVTFYLSFRATGGTDVPGLGIVMNEDVVLYHAGVYSWVFRGSDVGLGDGGGDEEDVDGIHVLSDNSILISTLGAPAVGGLSGLTEQDVLRCDGTFGASASCTWSQYFDGSDAGLEPASSENINALFELDNDLYFSTTGNFSVAGLSGGKNDISRCENSGGAPVVCSSFSGFFDGDRYGLPDDIDAAHFVPDAFADADPLLFRVVVLGSSTAAGTGASTAENSWVGLLDAWLATTNSNPELINFGKSGKTTEDFRPDGATPEPDPNRNISRVVELNPDMIIVNLPSNNVFEGISATTTIAHYNEIKALADAAGIPIFLTTTQPRNFTDLALRLLLQDEAIAVRTEFGAQVIDIYDELTDFNNDLGLKAIYDSGDGTHLNDGGHNYLFTTTRDLIAPSVPP